jgi:hypothetical protein
LDNAGVLDLAQKLFGKQRSESPAISDIYVHVFGKVIQDQASMSEDLTFDVHLVKSEVVNTTDDVDGEASALDDQTIQFIKVRQESAGASDSLVKVAQYLRSISDQSSVIESAAILTGKSFSDSTASADVILIQSGKGFSDQTIALDEPSFSVSKQLTDSYGALDSPALSLTKPSVADSAACSDDVILSPNKVSTDDALPQDEIIDFIFGKNVSDSGFIQEAKTISASLPKAEDVYMVDQPEKTLSKTFSDSVASADLFDYFVQAGIFTSDLPLIQETIVSNLSKSIQEGFSAQELMTLAMGRLAIDNGSAADQQVKSLSKGLADQSSSVDSGELRGQGYCDFDYFSEDYVGYSRTFT